MKQKFIIIVLLATVPAFVQAQLGSKLFNRVKNKVEARLEKKIDKETDKALDKAESGLDAAAKNGETTAEEAKTNETPVASPGLLSYAKYDFVPGEKIIYHNDFATDAMGEMPTGWNSNGTAAVSTIAGLKGNWVQLSQNSMYLTDNKDSLAENFTVEFDLVLRRTNPKAPFPMMAFGVLASGTFSPDANELLKNYVAEFTTELKIQPYDNSGSHMHLQTYRENSKYLTTDIKKYAVLEQFFNKIIHVAMQVQKERLRIWFNDTKLYDLPKAIAQGSHINQLYFDVKRYGGEDAEVGYSIGNIKIAKGLPDTRHKLVDEGRFSTTGILFDVNAVTIKPESNGVLKEVADVLQKYPDLKVNIIGHTDSDGSDAANLELSKKRAEAVKQTLIKDYAIDGERLESNGKGETIPVADNNSKEGKAQNRRVEFVKL